MPGLRRYFFPWYESIFFRGTKVFLSGVRGNNYLRYEGISVQSTRVLMSGVQRY